MNVVLLKTELLRRDGGTQPRAQLDPQVVTEYAEAIAAGEQLPPVTAFHDGADYWLADGFHRVSAAEKAGLTEIATDVRQGDRRAAVLFSTGVNADHGLRRTNADKRRAVDVLLRDAEWSQWSDREIARQCRVSHPLVAELRQALSGNSSRYDAARTVQRAGSSYPMNTAPIAAANAERPLFASQDALQSAIRRFLSKLHPGNLTAQQRWLNQIVMGNAVGERNLDTLVDWPHMARPLTRGELKRAALAVHAEYATQQPSPGRVVKFNLNSGSFDEQNWTPIHVLEQQARLYLALTIGPIGSPENDRVHLDRWIETLQAIHDKTDAGSQSLHLMLLDDHITQPCRQSDLLQACNNILDQLRQPRQAVSPFSTAPVAPPTNGNGHTPTIQPDPVDEHPRLTELADAVNAWLDDKVEGLDLADGDDARRYALNAILASRNGAPGGGHNEAWRDLRASKHWPAGATPEEKLEGIRAALRLLNHEPLVPPAPRPPVPPSTVGVIATPPASPVPAPTATLQPPAGGLVLTKLAVGLEQLIDELIACAAHLESLGCDANEHLASAIEQAQDLLTLTKGANA